MLPAVTFSPAKRFTPRIFGLESRPLRVEPWPFLCAMTLCRLDAGDLHGRQVLTVAVLAHVVARVLELEHDELLRAVLADDLGGDLRAADERLADADLAAVSRRDEQHLVEHDLRAGVARELLHRDGLTGLDPVLLSTGLNDSVHGTRD